MKPNPLRTSTDIGRLEQFKKREFGASYPKTFYPRAIELIKLGLQYERKLAANGGGAKQEPLLPPTPTPRPAPLPSSTLKFQHTDGTWHASPEPSRWFPRLFKR